MPWDVHLHAEAMVKPLAFKGDKKPKKRKRNVEIDNALDEPETKGVTTTNAAADEDDFWVSAEAVADISGPIVVVLQTEPPTCLACDANGKVFTSRLDNMIDGNPATAEPHDVRQVWVANRAAGTESLSFKGHHGRYVACPLNFLSDRGLTMHNPTDILAAISSASSARRMRPYHRKSLFCAYQLLEESARSASRLSMTPFSL